MTSEVDRINIAWETLRTAKAKSIQTLFQTKASIKHHVYNVFTMIASLYALCCLENIGSSRMWFYLNLVKSISTPIIISAGIYIPNIQPIAWNLVMLLILLQIELILSAPFIFVYAMDSQFVIVLVVISKFISVC
jgi:hypothetical protein